MTKLQKSIAVIAVVAVLAVMALALGQTEVLEQLVDILAEQANAESG